MAEKIVIISLRHKKKKGLGIFKEFLEAMIMFDVKIQKANMIQRKVKKFLYKRRMFQGLRRFNRDIQLVFRRGKVIDFKYYMVSVYKRHSTYLNELFNIELKKAYTLITDDQYDPQYIYDNITLIDNEQIAMYDTSTGK